MVSNIKNRPCPGLLLILAIAAFSLSAIWLWRSDMEWHGQQRLAQLLLLVPAILALSTLRQSYLPMQTVLVIGAILVLGLLSSLLAEHTTWALLEAARYLGLLALMLTCATLTTSKHRHLLLLLLLAISGIHALQFSLHYCMAFVSGIRALHSDILLSGFSNPRFFSQFQALALPLAAALGLLAMQRERKWAGALLFAVLSIQWCIAIVLGSRGLFLAFFCSTAAVVLFVQHHWRLAAWQVGALAIGALLYFIGFYLIPAWLDIPGGSRVLLREGLSARDIIWQLALNMTLENPWLGAGPMHFAAETNRIASHPHQMVLQWTAEWGIPATLLALWLIGKGMLRGLQVARSPQGTLLDVALWLCLLNALVLAQVDGIFVMPYTETWLAILAGLALGRWTIARPLSLPEKSGSVVAMVFAVLVLLPVLHEELPVFLDRQAELAEHHTGWKPRFWVNGWISESPANTHIE